MDNNTERAITPADVQVREMLQDDGIPDFLRDAPIHVQFREMHRASLIAAGDDGDIADDCYNAHMDQE